VSEWPALVELWIADQGPAATKTAYRGDAAQWTQWCADQGLDPLTAGREHGSQWRDYLHKKRKNAPRTVNRKLASMSSLYAYLEDEGIGNNWFLKVKRLNVDRQRSTTQALTEEELERLLAAAEEAGSATWLMVLVLVDLGIRVSELLNANVCDLRQEGADLMLRITRKRGKQQILPFSEEREADVLACVYTHLVDEDTGAVRVIRGRKMTFSDVDGDVPLIANSATGSRWRYKDVREALDALVVAAHLDRLTPHMLRATWATLARERGVSIVDVADVLGHASVDTARLYDKASGTRRRVKDAINKTAARRHGAS
jgi:integrase/recombinase XerD